MGELGAGAAQMHADIGRLARESGVERLLALGELGTHAARAFGAGGQHFARIEELLAEAENALVPGLTVLVKGSRFMQMERVVKALALESPAAGGHACC
jgi:UDP-N-acetylmuramoyl-tripeptide--D-alanyl-D-alanine ligase